MHKMRRASEEEFCELRLYGVLRSSAQGGSQKSAEPRPKTYERPRLISAYFGY
jgi:hypothetical protein